MKSKKPERQNIFNFLTIPEDMDVRLTITMT